MHVVDTATPAHPHLHTRRRATVHRHAGEAVISTYRHESGTENWSESLPHPYSSSRLSSLIDCCIYHLRHPTSTAERSDEQQVAKLCSTDLQVNGTPFIQSQRSHGGHPPRAFPPTFVSLQHVTGQHHHRAAHDTSSPTAIIAQSGPLARFGFTYAPAQDADAVPAAQPGSQYDEGIRA